MKTEPIKLKDAGACWHLDETPGNEYRVEIEPGEYLLVCAGQDPRKPAGAFTHPNIAAQQDRVHEFKHYLPGGGKKWTARPGRDFYFVIPRDVVSLLPEKGYSWIPATIAGVKVKFNVSGGSGSPGWCDWLNARPHISVGHSLSDMRKIAAVAVRGTPREPVKLPDLHEGEPERFEKLMGEHAGPGKLDAALAAGKKPVIVLAPGCQAADATEGEVSRIESRRRLVIANFRGYAYRIKFAQIDWKKTAERNAA